MDLYHIEDHSPGMVFWHPKGTKMVNALKDYIRGKIDRRGYLEVITPEIVNKTLWIKSGHADKYNENMFKSVQNECCDKTLAFWHDRVQPRTLKASTCSLATWKWP